MAAVSLPDVTEAVDGSLVPGAIQERKERVLPDGSIVSFEFAPTGWLTKAGKPRMQDWRAYHHRLSVLDKRTRMESVTTLLGRIDPKDALVPWAEKQGIMGAAEAVQRGKIGTDTDPEEAVLIVRQLGLGADAAKNRAADRGLNVHALLETYMLTGEIPNLADHPVEHHGYIQGLCGWLLESDPEPESVEELICDPGLGFAGRSDLVARVAGRRRRYDLKTQENCGIYVSAHYQCAMYEQGEIACGGEPSDELWVVVFAADGAHREMQCVVGPKAVSDALRYAASRKPVESACTKENTRERKARR